MDGLYLFLVVLLGVVSYSHDQVTGSVLEVSVRPGDNITLYCDCKKSSGVYIVWYRNCSHENQPPLILKITRGQADSFLKMFPRFIFVDNTSSNSFDLLIMNITESDEGIYYCGTEHTKVEGKDHIAPKYDYSYGDITTRIILNLSKTDHCQPSRPSTQDCGECWTLLFYLCPVSAVLSSLISTLVAYHLCRKKGNSVFKLAVLISGTFSIVNPHNLLTMRLFLFLQLKALKLSKNLQVDIKQIRLKMCVMLHWKSVSHHRDQRRRREGGVPGTSNWEET
ncbi:uncharacterized protein LOC119028749 [Acanthopagrus latus]|uniref:uncharacterized protein LOC119028749 n=1 Tax=Acanthopagrus latus TaxID=8177 RepID=UPI00187BF56C|nr:uncharacterized protein LOC119028749 [Acanthopagrus latus]